METTKPNGTSAGWRWAAGALLLALALAGCVGAPSMDPAVPAGTPDPDGDAADPAAADNLTVLRAAADPWADGETERVLFEDTVQAGQCYELATAWELVGGGYVMGGCAFFELDQGVLVPEGTQALRIEADATAALKSGEFLSFLYTTVRDDPTKANGGFTAEPVHTWHHALEAAEWDHPLAGQTGARMGFWTGWPGGGEAPPVLDGPIDVRVVVEKDPDFEPLPLLDPWLDVAPEHAPQEGVLTLLDAQVPFESGGLAGGLLSAEYTVAPALERLFPEGSTQLAVAMLWSEIDGCPPEHVCTLRTPLNSRGVWTGMGQLEDPQRLAGEGWRILIYDFPSMALPDSQYVETAGTRIYPWIDQCELGQGVEEATCLGVAPPVTTDARFVVEAWQEPVDVAALKARLGVS